MATDKILTLWQEWLEVSDLLLTALHQQTVAITLRDPKRAQLNHPVVNELYGKLKEIEIRAENETQHLAKMLDVKPTILSVIQKCEKNEQRKLHALINRVVIMTAKLRETTRKNELLLRRHLYPQRSIRMM